MLFLQTRTVLVEITKVNQDRSSYLIGDQKFEFIPQSI